MQPKKNEVHVKKVEELRDKIKAIRTEVSGAFNNREMSIVVTNLEQAELWAGQYVAKLKDE